MLSLTEAEFEAARAPFCANLAVSPPAIGQAAELVMGIGRAAAF